MRSSEVSPSISWCVGLTISSSPTGPKNGSGESIRAADAPLIARMSYGVIRSAESVMQMTCTSFLKPFGHSGRIGRSIMRAVRIAFSVGRPSRLKKPPGIFPAAYIRSSTSTVSGKKSAPSRASIRPCAVASTIVSPDRTTTAPSACLASFPVSNVSSRPPISTETEAWRSVAIAICFLHSPIREDGGLSQRLGGARSNFHPLFRPERRLPAEPQLLDEGSVSLEVCPLQVVQEPPPASDELQEAAARVVVVLVRPQMLRQLVDPARQHRDLDLRRTGVRF